MLFGKDAAVPLWGLTVGSFRDGDTHVIVLEGELDLATMQEVERELERVGGTDARLIAVDLRELKFIDCSGLRVIWRAHQREADRLLLIRGPYWVQQVFEITGLVRLLTFVDEPPKGVGARRFQRHAAHPASGGCPEEAVSEPGPVGP